MNARGRPHLKHRRTVLEENFGFFCALTTIDRFAIYMDLCTRGVCEVLAPRSRDSRLGKLPRGPGLEVSSQRRDFLKQEPPYEARA